MPAVLEQRSGSAPDPRPRKRWTRFEVQEYLRLGVPGLERYELFDGELIEKVSKNRRHVKAGINARKWLISVFGIDFVSIEEPVRLNPPHGTYTEPEPDVAVLAAPGLSFDEPPTPDQVLLVVEISDSTLDFDLGPKADRYAASGIADYWVLDVKQRRVVVHRDPVDGKYTNVLGYEAAESVAPLAKPEARVRVADLFAPEEKAGE